MCSILILRGVCNTSANADRVARRILGYGMRPSGRSRRRRCLLDARGALRLLGARERSRTGSTPRLRVVSGERVASTAMTERPGSTVRFLGASPRHRVAEQSRAVAGDASLRNLL